VGFEKATLKQDAVYRICDLLGIQRIEVSVGSTEPAEIFIEACRQLGLWHEGTKPEMAERVTRRAGLSWDEACDSRSTPSGGGSTVTLKGLNRVLEALEQLHHAGELGY
jgi:hypothetical protein